MGAILEGRTTEKNMIVSEVKGNCPTCGVGVTKKGSYCRAHFAVHRKFKEKTCRTCESDFTPHTANQKTCSQCLTAKRAIVKRARGRPKKVLIGPLEER